MRLLLLTAACTTLSGCLSVDPTELATQYVDEYNALGDDLGGYSETATLPTGNATYDGIAALAVADTWNADTGTVMVGDMALAADFDTARIDGTISDWIGAKDVDATADLASIESGAMLANGSLTVDGDITGASFNADVSGRLTLDGTDYRVGGQTNVTFVGPDAEGLTIYGDTDSDMSVTEDGTSVAGLLVGAASR